MRMLDLIEKKKNGIPHSVEELRFISQSAAEGGVPDYQLSAWLMAVRLKGMNGSEAVALTKAMAETGERLDLRNLAGPKIDKHSTGGVGDGISLALAPLLASAGVIVPMMSGRGLGHTGGTLDKLESISGFRVRLAADEVQRQLASIGVCMFGQSDRISPSDRKLYALRDATSTVDSLPLIVGSILSKKMAEDLSGLVLDIKCGSGAIFKDAKSAGVLARALVTTGRRLGLKCVGLITGMDQPLGRMVGNALEMRQSIEVLKGDRSCPDFIEVLMALGGWMMVLAGISRRWPDGAERLQKLIDDGSAARKFKEIIGAQGGNPRVVDNPDLLPKAAHVVEVKANRSGYLSALDARRVGEAAVALGAGRNRMEDVIEPGAGIELLKKVGDPVVRGDAIAKLFAGDALRLAPAESVFQSAVEIKARRPRVLPLIRKVLR